MNPGNTHWKKLYNLYSKIDEEAPRYLEFETWWGTPVLMNAEEMQWIADELFIGNKLSTGQLRASDGTRIDLRNVTSPIIVFCSWGDDITPPQQALGWITDLYDHESEIVAAGQTIVYTMHDSIGHLGIFVSGKVANKEHTEFAQCMEMIDLMPPGLYEAVITEEPSGSDPGVKNGKYLLRLEVRTLEDIRKLGVNPPEDERRFATVARVSEVNKSLYRTFAAPVVRSLFPEPVARAVQQLHPNRLKFSLLSDRNPLLRPVKALADSVRTRRQKVSADNPLLSVERAASSWIASALDGWGAMRGRLQEATFLGVYGLPAVQALAGFSPGTSERRHAERDLAREDRPGAEPIGAPDALRELGASSRPTARALVYIRIPEGRIDERGFAMLTSLRAEAPVEERRSLNELKQLFKEQFFLVRLDEERALESLPALLPSDPEKRRLGLDIVQRMLGAEDALSPEGVRRLKRIQALFEPRPLLAARAGPGRSEAAASGRRDDRLDLETCGDGECVALGRGAGGGMRNDARRRPEVHLCAAQRDPLRAHGDNGE